MLSSLPRTSGRHGSAERHGFTLIEALVSLSVISLMMALLIPAVQGTRQAARRMRCSANLKQLGIALHNYHDAHGTLPYGQAINSNDSSVWIKALPFLEQASLYNAINQDVSVFQAENSTLQGLSLNVLMCPSDYGATVRRANAALFAQLGNGDPNGKYQCFFTSYVGNFGSTDTTPHLPPDRRGFARPDGVLNTVSPLPFAAVTDGLSNTFLAGERCTAYLLKISAINPQIATSCGCYFRGSLGDTLFTTFYPPNMPKKVAIAAGLDHGLAASSLHPNIINVIMCDGSVRSVADSVSSWPFDPQTGKPLGAAEGPGGYWNNLPQPRLWQALSTRAGNEVDRE